MHESEGSDLRNAAARINAERSGWDGVGFMAIENLETGACGLVLVPKGTPRPNWSKELQDASPGWERHEDVQLAQWLPRCWGADLSMGDRFPELMNLLNRHIPARLLAQLPAPSRRLACGYGLGLHALPAVAGSSELLGRLVEWLQPWERLVVDPAGRKWAHHLHACPCAGLRMWNPTCCGMGAGGHTSGDRIAATGALEWGLIAGWSSVIDAVVAYLLAMADTLDAAGAVLSAPAGDALNEKPQRAKTSQTLTQAQGRLIAFALASSREPQIAVLIGTPRDELVLEWVKAHASDHISASVLRALKFDGLPAEWLDLAARDYPAGCSVADLASLRDNLTAKRFRSDVAKARGEISRSICSK
jgi:hypothetical protein